MDDLNPVYLALYKGKGDWRDKLIRFVTKGKYSHCEIAIAHWEDFGGYDRRKTYDCYSSSPRDGGVRKVRMNLKDGNWDLIPVAISPTHIRLYFEQTKGAKYDWTGVLGILLGIPQNKRKFFCSEWCFNALSLSTQGWRFSPNDLAAMMKLGSV